MLKSVAKNGAKVVVKTAVPWWARPIGKTLINRFNMAAVEPQSATDRTVSSIPHHISVEDQTKTCVDRLNQIYYSFASLRNRQ